MFLQGDVFHNITVGGDSPSRLHLITHLYHQKEKERDGLIVRNIMYDLSSQDRE